MTSLYTRIQDDEYLIQKLKPGQTAEFSDGAKYKCNTNGSLQKVNKPVKLTKKERSKRRRREKNKLLT